MTRFERGNKLDRDSAVLRIPSYGNLCQKLLDLHALYGIAQLRCVVPSALDLIGGFVN